MSVLRKRGRPNGSRSRVFIYQPVVPPERYLLSRSETAAALGVARSTISRWVRQWRTKGIGSGPRPIWLGPNGKPPLRFCIDDVLVPTETFPPFIERMRKRLLDDIEAEQNHAAKGATV